jgi:putative ABC transport system permease protein
MALPLRSSLRNIAVRRSSALFTALGIAMTVAVFAGVLSLYSGFQSIYEPHGSTDLAIYLRPGATSEGESALRREQVDILLKERPEILRDVHGRPLAAGEVFMAVFRDKLDGGKTNVTLRGIQPGSLALRDVELSGSEWTCNGELKLVKGRGFEFGSDEVVVGRRLVARIADCDVGDTLMVNLTPFRVVGVIETDTAASGEVWGDADRMMNALQQPVFHRVVARVAPGTDFAALSKELEHDARTPVNVWSEREYLSKQTLWTGGMLEFLAMFLTVIMGIAAVLGSMNTMLASVAARTHEVGVLLAIGYSRLAIFLAFLFESAVIGLIGGALGLLIALPFDGTETGLANWNTFTDVSFAFRLTPELAAKSFVLAFVLGLLGGALPALRAARLRPVEALREL